MFRVSSHHRPLLGETPLMKACRKGVPDISRVSAMRWLSVTEHLKPRTPSCTYIHITVAYITLWLKYLKKAWLQLVPIPLKSWGMKRQLWSREVDVIAETGVEKHVFFCFFATRCYALLTSVCWITWITKIEWLHTYGRGYCDQTWGTEFEMRTALDQGESVCEWEW